MPDPSDILKSLHTAITDIANSHDRASELANPDAIGTFCTALKQAHTEIAHAVAGNTFTPAETDMVRTQRTSVVEMTALIDNITRERMA
ncbi:MAG: hypothetical protein EA386_10455 [Rhodobacteraceae bacterium]|nr:MAG: hypothetical protein EA386_10455 [Paracoccaceae bacterium]